LTSKSSMVLLLGSATAENVSMPNVYNCLVL